MPHLVREILEQSRIARENFRYTEVHIETEALRRVFGPRVFDQLRKEWVEDDVDVIWLREIGENEAVLLHPYLKTFQFDFSANEYFLATSLDEDDGA